MNSEHAWPELHGTPCLTLDHVERKIQDSISESRTFPYDAVSRWAESALSGDEADYIERLRRRLDKAGVEIIPSSVNKPFTGDTPELQATSTFHYDALFPGETIVAACTAAGVRRRVIGMDPIVTPAQVTLASHTVRNPELKYDGRTFIPVRVTVDREHGTVRILTYDEPISGDSRRLGRELFPDLPDRKVYETEISLHAYDRMLQRAGWKYTFDEKSGRRIWMRPEAEKEVADAIEKESRNPENKPSEPEESQEPRQSERSEQPVAEVPAEPNRDSQAPRETSDISEAPAESDVIPAEPQQPQPSQPTSETPQKPATPPEPVELRPEDSVFIGGQEVPIMFINPDGSVETLSVLPINEKSVEDNGRYYTTFPSREALEAAAEHRPDGSMRVIRDGKELAPQDQTRAPKQPGSGNPAQPIDTPKQPGSNAPAEGNSDNPPREGNGGNPPSRPEGNGGNPPREPKQGSGNPPGEPEGNGGNPPREPKQGSGNPPREPEGEGGGEPPKSDPPSQPAEPTDPKGLREAADRAQRDIDALEKQIESHRAKEPSRLSAGTTYEAKHAKWQEKMDELQDQLPPLRELVLKWRAKADRLEEEQRQAEERRIIDEGGIPEDAEGNWQFHKVTPEHTYRFLTGRQGYTTDDVIATADANTDAKEPKKPKLGANAKANAEKLQDYNRRLEEFNRNRGYWQQVREIAVRHKAEAEEEARKAAEAARAEEIRRQEEERRRAEEEAARRAAEKGVGREITDRWNGAEKIQGIEDAIITPSGRTIRGRYVLVEEGAATPSHDPETGFAKSPGFPVDKNGNTVNDRDYERDKAAQQYVHRVAAGYDGRAVQDPVIVSRDGVVLSGNNRTMSGRIAARDNTDAGYIGHLETTAAKYGFTAEQVRSMKHPRLYFETGENLPYTAETFALFNKPEKKEMNVTERSVKLGKTISEGVFNRMAREMDAYETFAEYARSPEAVQAIKDLHAAGVIETAELPRYYDEQTGAITPEGVSLLQGALIGHVFNGNPDVVRMAMEHPAVRDSILKALVMLAENSRFSPEYSLIGDISRAIEIYHKGKEAGFRTVSESVLQHSLLEELDIPETTALVIADLLNGGKTTRLQKFLKEYNADARLADAGQLDIFSENAEPKPAEEILRQVYGHLGINPEQYERYEKLRNNGKPDEPDRPDNDPPTPSGPGGKPGGGGEPPQTPARPAGGTQQPGAGNGGLTPPAEPKDGGNPPTGNGGNPPAPEPHSDVLDRAFKKYIDSRMARGFDDKSAAMDACCEILREMAAEAKNMDEAAVEAFSAELEALAERETDRDRELEPIAEDFTDFVKQFFDISGRLRIIGQERAFRQKIADAEELPAAKPVKNKTDITEFTADAKDPHVTMRGVQHHPGLKAAVATDSFVVAVSPKDYDETSKGKIIGPDGEIEGKYFPVERVIPSEELLRDTVSGVDFALLEAKANNAVKRAREEKQPDRDPYIAVCASGGHAVVLRASRLKKFARAARHTGGRDLRIYRRDNTTWLIAGEPGGENGLALSLGAWDTEEVPYRITLGKAAKPEPDTPEASEPTQGYGSRPDLQAQGRRRDLAVEAKHARAKLRWNQKVLQQKEQRLRKILDRDPAMVEIAEAFGDSMETMEAEARKEVRMASDEVEYARAQVEQREAELKAVRREIREGLKQLGIQEDRETDISKARQVFDRHNTDPENAALMQRAADLAQSVGVKLIFTDRLPDGAGGAYDRIGIVRLPVDFLTEDFGRRYSRNILHEVIHSVTVYALETPERDLPEGLRKGARVLKEIYAELRDDPDFKGEYGSKTALEMTAELSNPLFRAKLKAKKLWHRVVDSVKTMLGLRPGSAYDAASRALKNSWTTSTPTFGANTATKSSANAGKTPAPTGPR